MFKKKPHKSLDTVLCLSVVQWHFTHSNVTQLILNTLNHNSIVLHVHFWCLSSKRDQPFVCHSTKIQLVISLGLGLCSFILPSMANYFLKKEEKKDFYRRRHGEENFLHILQGGAGKQQLAQDENKMLGDEEIRNTKELELIKSRIKALFFEKLNWFKQDQWWSNNKSHKKADLIWITSENGSWGPRYGP